MVKGFGCRQAYESLSCRNPRATVDGYGDFELRPMSAMARPTVGTDERLSHMTDLLPGGPLRISLDLRNQRLRQHTDTQSANTFWIRFVLPTSPLHRGATMPA